MKNEISVEAYKQPWVRGSPVMMRLPYKGYRDNEVARALVTPMDYHLTRIKGLLEGFWARLDPEICLEADMEYVGFLLGYSERFWDNTWTVQVKRQFLTRAVELWRLRGTLMGIREVLAIHGIQSDVWTDGTLLLPFTMPGTMGTPRARVFVRLPLLYLRHSPQWLEAERSRQNWLPAAIDTKVCYNKFYIGFSVLGEPMF